MIYRTTLQCYYRPGRRSAGLGARLRAPPCRFRFAYTDVSRGGGGDLTRLAFARRKLVPREKWKKKKRRRRYIIVHTDSLYIKRIKHVYFIYYYYYCFLF